MGYVRAPPNGKRPPFAKTRGSKTIVKPLRLPAPLTTTQSLIRGGVLGASAGVPPKQQYVLSELEKRPQPAASLPSTPPLMDRLTAAPETRSFIIPGGETSAPPSPRSSFFGATGEHHPLKPGVPLESLFHSTLRLHDQPIRALPVVGSGRARAGCPAQAIFPAPVGAPPLPDPFALDESVDETKAAMDLPHPASRSRSSSGSLTTISNTPPISPDAESDVPFLSLFAL